MIVNILAWIGGLGLFAGAFGTLVHFTTRQPEHKNKTERREFAILHLVAHEGLTELQINGLRGRTNWMANHNAIVVMANKGWVTFELVPNSDLVVTITPLGRQLLDTDRAHELLHNAPIPAPVAEIDPFAWFIWPISSDQSGFAETYSPAPFPISDLPTHRQS